jgi:hypothetical protein
MFDNINTELQLIAQEAYDAVTQAMYEDYIDEILANEELMMYASNSYDCDCVYYGKQ